MDTLTKPIWAPQAGPQTDFITAKTYEALLGGAAGGGKSDALIGFNLARRGKYPGSKGLIIRRTFAELSKEGALIPRSHELCPAAGFRWDGSHHKWIDRNAGVIEFGYLENENDKFKYQSSAYDDISFDELTHFPESQYIYMMSRARSIRGVPTAIRAATNPGNIGHAWVKARFISPAPAKQIIEYKVPDPMATGGFVTKARVFIPAKVWDNKILMSKDPAYVSNLMMLPEKERRALLEGDWDIFEGQFFSEFRRELHVCKPFRIPEDWPRSRCFDWGMAHPLAHYWLAFDYEGRGWVYREYHKSEKLPPDAAKEIHLLGGREKYYATYCGPDIFAKKGEAPRSIAQQMSDVMGSLYPAKNNRVNGAQALRRWLSLAPDGKPWIQIFDLCTNLIRVLPELIHDPLDPEDVLKVDGDDPYDALRYGLVMRELPPVKKEPGVPETLDDRSYEFWSRQRRVKNEENEEPLAGFD